MLLFLDGQAHYDTSRLAMKYSAVASGNCVWSVTSEGRFGNCIKRVAVSNSVTTRGYLVLAPLTTRLGPWTPTASGVCGCAIKVDDLDRLTGGIQMTDAIFGVAEGSNYHLRVNLNPNGTFSLIRNQGSTSEGSSGPTILAQSSEGLTEGTWQFVEFKWLIAASGGTFEIRVGGITVLSYTGATKEQDPFFNSLGVWNAVTLLNVTSQPTPYLVVRMCDLYLADLTTATADDVSDFLGDGTITTIMPNGVGASSDWVPVGTAANWDATNDRPAPDDDGTYVSTTGVGTQDTYQYQDIPPGAQVKGVQVNILARKETEGSVAIAPVVHQGSTDYVGPTQGVTTLAYDRYVTQTWDLNPATGVKFTAGEINAGQFGVKKVI